MPGINALDRTALQRSLNVLKREMADIGGANTPEMKAAGRVLASSIRKQLSTRGSLLQGPHRASKTGKPSKFRGLPSSPGEPPHRISGKTYKSIGTEIVGGVLRVGSGYFVARLMQFGVDADETRKAKLARAVTASRARRRRRSTKPSRQAHLKIAPRPFMEKALADALPKMGDDFVATLQKRGGST